MKSFVPFALAGLLGIAASAQANTITFTAEKPLSTANWRDILVLDKFNTSLGTLNSITFGLVGSAQGIGRVESLAGAATHITLSLGSIFTLSRPDSSSLVNVNNPIFSQNFSLSGFDGAIDFAGASGGSTGLLSSSKSNSFTSTSINDFALFSAVGGGKINLGISATAMSDSAGAGNLVAYVQTLAAGYTTVSYNYTAAPIPEPETYAMMLVGIGLLGFAKRRKATKNLTQ